jgi:hypothetical protein
MTKGQRRFKRITLRFERLDLLARAGHAAAFVGEIFVIVGSLIGAAAIVAMEIRRERRDRSAAVK